MINRCIDFNYAVICGTLIFVLYCEGHLTDIVFKIQDKFSLY